MSFIYGKREDDVKGEGVLLFNALIGTILQTFIAGIFDVASYAIEAYIDNVPVLRVWELKSGAERLKKCIVPIATTTLLATLYITEVRSQHCSSTNAT